MCDRESANPEHPRAITDLNQPEQLGGGRGRDGSCGTAHLDDLAGGEEGNLRLVLGRGLALDDPDSLEEKILDRVILWRGHRTSQRAVFGERPG